MTVIENVFFLHEPRAETNLLAPELVILILKQRYYHTINTNLFHPSLVKSFIKLSEIYNVSEREYRTTKHRIWSKTRSHPTTSNQLYFDKERLGSNDLETWNIS